jgi:hypothetical protein
LPFEKPISKAIAFLLFVLIFISVVAIGKVFGLDLSKESNFATLTALLSASLAGVLTLVGQRILFDQKPTRPLSMGLKIILALTIPLALALAIWDGIDARHRDQAESRLQPPSLNQQLQSANSQDLSNAIQHVQELRLQQQSGSPQPPPTPGANP